MARVNGIRREVWEFAKLMSDRLDENEHRTEKMHWCGLSKHDLLERARRNLRKNTYNPVDSANYSMMLFRNYGMDKEVWLFGLRGCEICIGQDNEKE